MRINIHLTANLPRNLSVNFIIGQDLKNYSNESVARFFGPPCIWVKNSSLRTKVKIMSRSRVKVIGLAGMTTRSV